MPKFVIRSVAKACTVALIELPEQLHGEIIKRMINEKASQHA